MAFQDWQVPGEGELSLNWRKGTSFPSQSITVNIRDILGESEASNYDTLEYSIAPFGHAPWVSITGGPALGTYVLINQTGIQLNLTASITASATSLNNGNTYSSVDIFIFGRNGQGQRDVLFYTSFRFNLNVYAADQPILLPNKLNFTHEHQSLAPNFQEMNVDAIGSWQIVLSLTTLLEVEIVSGNLLKEEVLIFNTPTYRISGVNAGTFRIRPTQLYLNTLSISSNPYEIGLGMLTTATPNSNWYLTNNSLFINVVQSSEIIVLPSNLEFRAIKTVYEASSQNISIESLYNFTIIMPSWAYASVQNGSVGINSIDISVALSDTLATGIYSDNIILEYDNGNGIQNYLIPIVFLVEGFVDLPYNTEEFNFTLDNKMVKFYTDLDDTFFELEINVKVYDFFSSNFTNHTIPLKIPLLRGRQKENIGLKIHRLMKRLEEIDLTNNTQYRSCEVVLNVKEKDINTLELKRDFTLDSLVFIAGISPSLSNDMGFLSINPNPTRVTAIGKQSVNLLIKNGSRKIEIYKNESLLNTYYINANNFNIYKDYIDFGNLGVKEGDIIEYKLYTDLYNTESISKKYFVFPEGPQNILIVWEDEYRLQSRFEFTGEFSLKTEFDSKIFKKYKDIVEVLENVRTIKEVKFQINTGFILKTDSITIDSICRARKAWLIINNDVFEVIPQTKHLVNIDSDRELESFDLDFIINKKTNEEIYSF